MLLIVDPSKEAEVGKGLARGTAGAAGAARYAALCNGVLSNQSEVGAYPKSAQGLAGHQSGGGE